jgi:ankyrin repeat protein
MLDLGADILTAKLIDAACSGNLSRVKELVQLGAQAEVGDYDGRTPLHLAAAGGHLEEMKYLHLQHGVDIHAEDRYGNTPMHDAMENNHTEAVRWLKKLGAKANLNNGYMKDRDILQAAAEGNIVEVQWRLKQNNDLANAADYDRRTALHVAASEGHDLVVR